MVHHRRRSPRSKLHHRRRNLEAASINNLLNRHPADRLADVRAELKRLEAEEVKLRAYLLEHPQDRTGEEHVAVIGSQSRKRVDLKALADEIGASILARFTTFGTAMVVRLQQRQHNA